MSFTGEHDRVLSTDETTSGESLLQEFLTTTVVLSPEERHQVVEQGQAMLEQFYVHLPLKRAIHAIEPIQRLRLLNYRLDHMSEWQFYDEMISIFMGVQDLHTNFILPPPFQGTRVSLPVFIEEFFEGDERKYIVSQVAPNLGDPLFKPGVVITHWNGIPIDRAVELNARRQGGSNPPASHARGLNALTARTLRLSQPPDEEWVVLGYVADGQDREIRLNWQVVVPPPSPTAVDPNSLEDPASRALGIDIQTEDIRRARKTLFVPEAMELEQQDSATLEASGVSTFPDKLEFRTVSTPHGAFGYIRIRSFNVQEPEPFVDEVTRILGLLPKNGLIVDVRSNGGGNVLAGERLLQLFTPRTIEPERMSLINTPSTLELCKRTSWLAPWKESIEQAVETAAIHSDGFPIVPEEAEACNRRGQQYYGPVLLITNALCYSTTDMFAAGWQDHEIGPIVGTDRNTGAGGANVFTHEFLQQLLPDKVKPLPKRTSFRVAIRRATRVGKRSGTLLEELGVVPDEFHSMTKNDVLNQNEDLITHAASILAGLPVRALDVELRFARPGGPLEKGNVDVWATVQNISRLDAYVDGRPRRSIDVDDEANTQVFEVMVGDPGFHTLEIRGFYDDELVAVKRVEVQIEA
jgi:hypothetical protein